MAEKKYAVSNGIGFFGILTIAFIVLKLSNYIAWGWIWVLAPLWGPTVFFVVMAFFIIFIGGLLKALDDIKSRK